MGIVRQKDKRSGITYAYESISYWDKEKRQSRSRRRLIGRVGADGEIIPTDGRCRHDGENPLRTRRRGPLPVTQIQRSYYGATYLLDAIADSTGVADDLRRCFPDDYRKILSVAYFLILGGSRALMNFRYWAADHLHPHGADLSSQDCSRQVSRRPLKSKSNGLNNEFPRRTYMELNKIKHCVEQFVEQKLPACLES